MYTVDYFINKFEKIPESRWLVNGFGLSGGKSHCSMGHCGEIRNGNFYMNAESNFLTKLFGGDVETVFIINDGGNRSYQQPTPKQRILAALYDIRATEFLKDTDLRGCKLIRAIEPYRNKPGKKIYDGVFVCKCGKEFTTQLEKIKSGNTTSCGCYRKEWMEKTFVKHGMAGHPLYQCWHNMLGRCTDVKHQNYFNYGGRGILVCDDWMDLSKFLNWANSSGWQIGLTIERVDNDGGYCPENCKWIPQSEQPKNTRRTKKHQDITKDLAVLPEDKIETDLPVKELIKN